MDLKGQTIQIGDKSKFKIKEDTYCAITKNIKSSFTCVFSTDNELARYKTGIIIVEIFTVTEYNFINIC